MLNVGPLELIVIVVAALVLLGPEKLPELARGLGKFLREFRRQTDDVRNVVEREFYKMDQELRESEQKQLSVLPENALDHEVDPSEALTRLGGTLAGQELGSSGAELPARGAVEGGLAAPGLEGEPTAAREETPEPPPMIELPPHQDPPLPTFRPPHGTVARGASSAPEPSQTVTLPPPGRPAAAEPADDEPTTPGDV